MAYGLTELPFDLQQGYWPSASAFPPPELRATIRKGLNCWLRPMSRVEAAKGLAQTSATNVGARLFAVNSQRASIAGGLVSGRLPFASVLRYQNAVLFFLSELTSQQLYLDETAVTGVTTSATAGGLRIAVPSGVGTYNTYDAGFDPPSLPTGNVTTSAGGTKAMTGSTGVALAAWRTTTNAISAPSNIVYKTMTPSTNDRMNVQLPSAVSGQDGWIMAGTRWGDQSGAVRVVRYVYLTPRGTFTATNGTTTLTGDSSTRWLRDLRVGDVVTIDAASYTIATVTGNAAATLSTNFGGTTGSGKTATLTTVAADWYNEELGDLLSFDVIKPPPSAGIVQFGGRAFIWGTAGGSGNVTGNCITPLLENNPEHVGLLNIITTNGDDLVNVLPGDQTLFLMTKNTLEIVTFTGATDDPYRIRAYDGVTGFQTPSAGIIYKNQFYGYQEKPLRTMTDKDIDVEFGRAVWSDMKTWSASRVVMAVDPKNEAVLYCHFDGASTTTVIPWMTQQGVWGVPIQFTGQVTDSCVIGGNCYLMVLSGGNYRVNTWEGGSGVSPSYFATQFQTDHTTRWKVKNFVITGAVNNLYAYTIVPGGALPDVTDTGQAVASFPLSGTELSYSTIFCNLAPARGVAVQVTLVTGTGTCEKVNALAYPVDIRK